jgi:hypothetical protein
MNKIEDKPNFLTKNKRRNPLVKMMRTDAYFQHRIEKSAKAYKRVPKNQLRWDDGE